MGEVELRAHIIAIIDERDRRYDERFKASERALELAARTARVERDKSESSLDKRFAYVNELRGALSDLSATMLTRAEFQAENKGISGRMDALTGRIDQIERNAQTSLWGYIVGIIGLVIAGISAFLHRG